MIIAKSGEIISLNCLCRVHENWKLNDRGGTISYFGTIYQNVQTKSVIIEVGSTTFKSIEYFVLTLKGRLLADQNCTNHAILTKISTKT